MRTSALIIGQTAQFRGPLIGLNVIARIGKLIATATTSGGLFSGRRFLLVETWDRLLATGAACRPYIKTTERTIVPDAQIDRSATSRKELRRRQHQNYERFDHAIAVTRVQFCLFISIGNVTSGQSRDLRNPVSLGEILDFQKTFYGLSGLNYWLEVQKSLKSLIALSAFARLSGFRIALIARIVILTARNILFGR